MGSTPMPVAHRNGSQIEQLSVGMILLARQLAIAVVFACAIIAFPGGLITLEVVHTPARELRDAASVRDLLRQGRLSFELQRPIGDTTTLANFGP